MKGDMSTYSLVLRESGFIYQQKHRHEYVKSLAEDSTCIPAFKKTKKLHIELPPWRNHWNKNAYMLLSDNTMLNSCIALQDRIESHKFHLLFHLPPVCSVNIFSLMKTNNSIGE